jgi:hypothetical protein
MRLPPASHMMTTGCIARGKPAMAPAGPRSRARRDGAPEAMEKGSETAAIRPVLHQAIQISSQDKEMSIGVTRGKHGENIYLWEGPSCGGAQHYSSNFRQDRLQCGMFEAQQRMWIRQRRICQRLVAENAFKAGKSMSISQAK